MSCLLNLTNHRLHREDTRAGQQGSSRKGESPLRTLKGESPDRSLSFLGGRSFLRWRGSFCGRCLCRSFWTSEFINRRIEYSDSLSMLGHGTLLVTIWRLKIEPDLQEPQQAQQGQEQHHLHDQHRRPPGQPQASASRRTSSSTCSAATPASRWRSRCCHLGPRSP